MDIYIKSDEVWYLGATAPSEHDAIRQAELFLNSEQVFIKDVGIVTVQAVKIGEDGQEHEVVAPEEPEEP